MAKQDYISRYLSIIKKLMRTREATFKEISEYLTKESEYQDRPFSISTRTFQLDLNEIRDIFKIDIQFDFSKQVYYIAGDEKPEEIILSFDPEQGKYIKSYPLHETQTIINDSDDELRVRLHLYITHDLRMELMSYGDSVTVIAPKRLGKELSTIYKNALKQDENS